MTSDFESLQPHLSAQLIADINASIPLLANNADSSPSSCPNNASSLPPKRDLLLNSFVHSNNSASTTSSDFDALLHHRPPHCPSIDEFGPSNHMLGVGGGGANILGQNHLQQQQQQQQHPRHDRDFGGVVNGLLRSDSCEGVTSGLSGTGGGLSTATLKMRTLDTGKATLDHFNVEPL